MSSPGKEQVKHRNHNVKINRGWRYFRYLFFTVVFIVSTYILVMAYLSPVMKINELTKAAIASGNGNLGMIRSDDAEYMNLLKEEAFLKSRISMAAQDSVCLTVDLIDSLVMLEIQGVVVHRVKTKKIKNSSLLKHIHPQILINRFSYPQNLDSVAASFPKLVLTHKEAPADTNQQTELVIPDTSKIEPAYVKMFLSDDFILTFREAGNSNKKDINRIARKQQLDYSLNFLKQMLNFSVPNYTPWIEIELPGRDIQTIYRAIPQKAIITLRI